MHLFGSGNEVSVSEEPETDIEKIMIGEKMKQVSASCLTGMYCRLFIS